MIKQYNIETFGPFFMKSPLYLYENNHLAQRIYVYSAITRVFTSPWANNCRSSAIFRSLLNDTSMKRTLKYLGFYLHKACHFRYNLPYIDMCTNHLYLYKRHQHDMHQLLYIRQYLNDR